MAEVLPLFPRQEQLQRTVPSEEVQALRARLREEQRRLKAAKAQHAEEVRRQHHMVSRALRRQAKGMDVHGFT